MKKLATYVWNEAIEETKQFTLKKKDCTKNSLGSSILLGSDQQFLQVADCMDINVLRKIVIQLSHGQEVRNAVWDISIYIYLKEFTRKCLSKNSNIGLLIINIGKMPREIEKELKIAT